jgi:hypothetical protein
VTVVGLFDADIPDGVTDAVRETVPWNPPRLVSEMLADPDWPALMMRFDMLDDIEKSPTFTVTWTLWVNDPLEAVIVMT